MGAGARQEAQTVKGRKEGRKEGRMNEPKQRFGHVCVCMYVCMYVCVCVCACVCECGCGCECVYASVWWWWWGGWWWWGVGEFMTAISVALWRWSLSEDRRQSATNHCPALSRAAVRRAARVLFCLVRRSCRSRQAVFGCMWRRTPQRTSSRVP